MSHNNYRGVLEYLEASEMDIVDASCALSTALAMIAVDARVSREHFLSSVGATYDVIEKAYNRKINASTTSTLQ